MVSAPCIPCPTRRHAPQIAGHPVAEQLVLHCGLQMFPLGPGGRGQAAESPRPHQNEAGGGEPTSWQLPSRQGGERERPCNSSGNRPSCRVPGGLQGVPPRPRAVCPWTSPTWFTCIRQGRRGAGTGRSPYRNLLETLYCPHSTL